MKDAIQAAEHAAMHKLLPPDLFSGLLAISADAVIAVDDEGVRRYGFHGTSHRYIAYRYRKLTGRSREDTRIITLHLGNGASACVDAQGARVALWVIPTDEEPLIARDT